MATSKIYVGAKVENKKGQKGEITRIITKSTGYVEVTFENGSKGKEMAFNLKNEAGEPLKAMPKPRKARVLTTADKIQIWKKEVLKVNVHEMYNEDSLKLLDSMLSSTRDANDFQKSLVDQFFKARFGKGRISEKQAYYIAKYIVENDK